MAFIFFGSLIFGYGLLSIHGNNGVFGWLPITIGLTMALRGTANVAADLVVMRLRQGDVEAIEEHHE
jgi:hypothetical protein